MVNRSILRNRGPVTKELIRLKSKVNKKGCWIWNGLKNENQYGHLKVNGKRKIASRASFEIFNGPIPKNMEVCHSCDVPSCVNPKHLWIGTRKENMADCAKKKRYIHYVCPEKITRGEKHHFSKLNENKVRKIRSLYVPRKYSIYRLAKEFGVNPITIYDIVKGNHWRHVKDAV